MTKRDGARGTQTNESWVSALGSGRRALATFVATKRDLERFTEPPRIWHVEIAYTRWDGVIGLWEEHFGKGRQQVYPPDAGEPYRSCNEMRSRRCSGA